MRTDAIRSITSALLVAATLAMPGLAGAQENAPDSRPGLAVLPFENGGSYGANSEDLALLGIGLQQSLMYELAANTNLRVVDRAILQELMSEQELGASGRVDPATAARIGRVVGARYVLAGGFIDLQGNMSLTSRIVDTETSELVASAQVRGDRDDLFELLGTLAADVTREVELPALPAQVREARKERKLPPEAMMRHAMILSFRDEGNTERAIALYRDLVSDFPQVEEWQTELRQLTTG